MHNRGIGDNHGHIRYDSTGFIRTPDTKQVIAELRKALADDPGAKYFLRFAEGKLPKGIEERADEIASLHSNGRFAAGRAADIVMTATYWATGRRIVDFEQQGKNRATYGERLLDQLSSDLKRRCGRGYSVDNLELMRLFYLTYPSGPISETLSRKSQSVEPADIFTLSWSHYVLLCRRVKSKQARMFYETSAIQGGWVVRDLERQIETKYYERTVLSRKTLVTTVKKNSPESIDDTINDTFNVVEVTTGAASAGESDW